MNHASTPLEKTVDLSYSNERSFLHQVKLFVHFSTGKVMLSQLFEYATYHQNSVSYIFWDIMI